jgi:N-acetyl-anhydromuramoyl-L-alanine amidase
LKVTTATGLLEGAQYLPSTNQDNRPDDMAIDVLVIHAISMPPGEYGSGDIERLFANTLNFEAHPFFVPIAGIRVSAHLLIRRNGEVVQFVPFTQRAWHAGASQFEGRARVNDFSIGIELEGSDHTPFEEVQYQSLIEVTRALGHAYPGIVEERIVGHADIAPGRKTDPGPYFNWRRYRNALI